MPSFRWFSGAMARCCKLTHFEWVSRRCCEIPQCGSCELQRRDLLHLASECRGSWGGMAVVREIGSLESMDYSGCERAIRGVAKFGGVRRNATAWMREDARIRRSREKYFRRNGAVGLLSDLALEDDSELFGFIGRCGRHVDGEDSHALVVLGNGCRRGGGCHRNDGGMRGSG